MNNENWNIQSAPFLVGVVSNTSVTTDLCFDGLAGLDTSITFRYIDPYDRDASPMDDCDIIVFVRHLFMAVYQAAFQEAKRREKPLYLLVDDNFVVLSGEKQPNPADDEIFKHYGQPIFRDTLRQMDGILSASSALTEFYESYHHNILPFGAISDRMIQPRRALASDDLRVGFFGGSFRAETLRREVLPALKTAAAKRPVTLVAGPSVQKFQDEIDDAGIDLVVIPVISNFRRFIRTWQSLGIDVAVHPKGETANIKYKTPNAVLVSHYLGAVPIVWDEPAYFGMGEANGVLKVGDIDFASALSSIEKTARREVLLTALATFCDSTFSPIANIRTLRRLRQQLWPELHGDWQEVAGLPSIGESHDHT